MANIRVDLDYPVRDGLSVVFRSPCDCTEITGLIVYYLSEGGEQASKEFALADAHGENVGDIPHLFAADVVVKVILDVTSSMAFVQNADTNAYLEGRFDEMLPKKELQTAVNAALAQAKESGEFDGKDGKDGKDGQDGKTGEQGIPGPVSPQAEFVISKGVEDQDSVCVFEECGASVSANDNSAYFDKEYIVINEDTYKLSKEAMLALPGKKLAGSGSVAWNGWDTQPQGWKDSETNHNGSAPICTAKLKVRYADDPIYLSMKLPGEARFETDLLVRPGMREPNGSGTYTVADNIGAIYPVEYTQLPDDVVVCIGHLSLYTLSREKNAQWKLFDKVPIPDGHAMYDIPWSGESTTIGASKITVCDGYARFALKRDDFAPGASGSLAKCLHFWGMHKAIDLANTRAMIAFFETWTETPAAVGNIYAAIGVDQKSADLTKVTQNFWGRRVLITTEPQVIIGHCVSDALYDELRDTPNDPRMVFADYGASFSSPYDAEQATADHEADTNAHPDIKQSINTLSTKVDRVIQPTEVKKQGINLNDGVYEPGYLENDGTEADTNLKASFRNANYIPVEGGRKITVWYDAAEWNGNNQGIAPRLVQYDASKNIIGAMKNISTYTSSRDGFQLESNTAFVRLAMVKWTGDITTPLSDIKLAMYYLEDARHGYVDPSVGAEIYYGISAEDVWVNNPDGTKVTLPEKLEGMLEGTDIEAKLSVIEPVDILTPSINLNKGNYQYGDFDDDGNERNGTTGQSFRTVDYIPVTGGRKIAVYYDAAAWNGENQGYGVQLVQYDKNKTIISRTTMSTYVANRNGTQLDANAAYIRVAMNRWTALNTALTDIKMAIYYLEDARMAFVEYGYGMESAYGVMGDNVHIANPDGTNETLSDKLARLVGELETITPVKSVNSKTGAVQLSAEDVGAEKSGAAASAVSAHNTKTDAHNDIRLLISALANRLDALANSDDETLDQMAEVVAYIRDNRELIEQVTTGKISVTDIVDNLTTNVSNKPLSAAQGVALKALIDSITIPTKLSQLTNDKNFLTSYTETDPTVPSWAKATSKPTYTASEVGALSADSLSGAVNTALAQAKASGDFKGEKGDTGAAGATGQRGQGLLAITTAPSAYTTEVNGLTPAYRIALSTVKTQASTDAVYAGDTIRYSYYHYPVIYVDSSYVYCRARVSIRGAAGTAGAAGKTAYAYAQEGGFEGSETVFSQIMADMPDVIQPVSTQGRSTNFNPGVYEGGYFNDAGTENNSNAGYNFRSADYIPVEGGKKIGVYFPAATWNGNNVGYNAQLVQYDSSKAILVGKKNMPTLGSSINNLTQLDANTAYIRIAMAFWSNPLNVALTDIKVALYYEEDKRQEFLDYGVGLEPAYGVPSDKVCITSPNGTKYALSVSDSGVLSVKPYDS